MAKLKWDFPAVFSIIPTFPQLDNLKVTFPVPDDYNMDPFLKYLPSIVQLELPQISQSTLHLVSDECLPSLRMLRVPVNPETLSMHLTMLCNQAGNGFRTEGILFWSNWKQGIESKIHDDKRHLIERLTGEGLLQLGYLHKTYTQMTDFVPSSLLP